jgi:HPr kinase/phosphorylase
MSGDATSEPAPVAPDGTLLHASAVAIGDRGVLILGPSGSGKSSLALALMATGARLVADDGVILRAGADGRLHARAPEATRGLIEARGVGLLKAAALSTAPLALVVDLGETETERLPPERTRTILGMTLPVVHKVESPHFPAAVQQYLVGGRSA